MALDLKKVKSIHLGEGWRKFDFIAYAPSLALRSPNAAGGITDTTIQGTPGQDVPVLKCVLSGSDVTTKFSYVLLNQVVGFGSEEDV